MKFKKLPLSVFLETFQYAPRPGISVLITDDRKKSVLLTKRLDHPFANYWHLPGSFLYKGEELLACVDRVLKDELGMQAINEEKQLVGVFDDIKDDPRGHVVDIIYGIHLKSIPDFVPVGATKEIKFFKTLPPKIGFNHRQTLRKLGFT